MSLSAANCQRKKRGINSKLPPWGTIYSVEPSRFYSGAAYITVDLHQENHFDPFVYKTTDFGATWKSISATIPKSPLSYAHCIKEDPFRRGMLYLGTEGGLYVLFDDGEHWQPPQNNLPHVPVYGITVQESFKDLVVATYGRGFWILDDVAPLEQMTPGVANSNIHLFAPRSAYRFRGITPPMAAVYDATDGQNPPYGADVNYLLKSVPEGDVRIVISDEKGQTIRTLSGSKKAGMNRVWWDLRCSPTPDIVLRTSPVYTSWMHVGPKGRTLGGRISLLATPGTYKVKLIVGAKNLPSHSPCSRIHILRELLPTFVCNMPSYRAFKQSQERRGDEVENLRRQAEDLKIRSSAGGEQVGSAAELLDQKLTRFEENLRQLRITGGQDGMRWPATIQEKLGHLVSELQEADFPSTSQQVAVNRQYTADIRDLQAQLNCLLSNDNIILKSYNLPAVSADAVSGGQQ